MNIENITSDKMSLNYDSKTMQIKVYEDLLKKKNDELDQYKNNWEELKKWLKEEIERLMKVEQTNNVIFLIGTYDEVLDKMKELDGDK